MEISYFKSDWKPTAYLVTAIALVLIAILGYVYVLEHPIEPAYEGNFPSQLVWIFTAPERVVSTPVVGGDSVIVRSQNSLCKIKAVSGEKEWCRSSPNDSKLSLSPLLVDDLIIVPEKDSHIGAYSLDTGNLIWRTIKDYYYVSDPRLMTIEAILYGNGMLFVARGNNKLMTYNLATGQVEWAVDAPNRSNLYLTTDDDTVYLAGGHRIMAYGMKDGNLLWDRDFQSLPGPILIDQDVLYVAEFNGKSILTAFDLSTQTERWNVLFPMIDDFNPQCLSAYGDVVYLSGQVIIAIDKNSGRVKWSGETEDFLECPVVLGNEVFIRNINNYLYVLDRNTGQEKGRLRIQSNTPMIHEPNRSPAIWEDLLIIPFGDNRVYAYRP